MRSERVFLLHLGIAPAALPPKCANRSKGCRYEYNSHPCHFFLSWRASSQFSDVSLQARKRRDSVRGI